MLGRIQIAKVLLEDIVLIVIYDVANTHFMSDLIVQIGCFGISKFAM